jgi:hypothetical protein
LLTVKSIPDSLYWSSVSHQSANTIEINQSVYLDSEQKPTRDHQKAVFVVYKKTRVKTKSQVRFYGIPLLKVWAGLGDRDLLTGSYGYKAGTSFSDLLGYFRGVTGGAGAVVAGVSLDFARNSKGVRIWGGNIASLPHEVFGTAVGVEVGLYELFIAIDESAQHELSYTVLKSGMGWQDQIQDKQLLDTKQVANIRLH